MSTTYTQTAAQPITRHDGTQVALTDDDYDTATRILSHAKGIAQCTGSVGASHTEEGPGGVSVATGHWHRHAPEPNQQRRSQ